MTARLLALSLLALAAAGCALEVDPEAAPSEVALTMSSTTAALVLDLANYPGVDQATLDDAVGLDARAAARIAEHRAGADGLFPSDDDDLFDDIAELDGVPYVGDTAFQRLQAYAELHPAPAAESVEGVLFRGWESEAVVWGVNTAPLSVLDAMLDGRAARALHDGRPFVSVTEMGPLSYVGVSALTRLRAEAGAFWAAMRGGSSPSLAGTFDGVAFDEATARVALDIASRATYEQMVANGVYAQGAAAIVGNRPYADLAAVAAVSGVGASTMQGLRSYALSGAWDAPVDPEPTPDPDPTPTPTPVEDCVFGATYREMLAGGAIVTVAQRVLDPSSSTNATQRAQIVAAVQSAYAHVTTVSQAFAAVDQSEINHTELWDASNRRAYTAYEFGAGDNSYGLVFELGTTIVATRIVDGDLLGCTVGWGQEMRVCARTEDCAEGLACIGQNADDMSGRCIDLRATEHPSAGADCVVESGCPVGSGLVCGGAATWGAGICQPAWMRGQFQIAPEVSIPDGAAAGVIAEIPVFGLASVDMDVVIDLRIDHARPSDLLVTLENPATAEVVVVDGAGRTGAELVLRGHVVRGFSGDEQVNGTWRLRVVDRVAGQTGTLMHANLTITSRWD